DILNVPNGCVVRAYSHRQNRTLLLKAFPGELQQPVFGDNRRHMGDNVVVELDKGVEASGLEESDGMELGVFEEYVADIDQGGEIQAAVDESVFRVVRVESGDV